MEANQLYLLAGGLLVFSLLMLGGGIALYRNQGEKEKEHIRDQKKQAREIPAVEKQVSREESSPADRLEILRVYRNPLDAELLIQIMGQTAKHPGEMSPGQVNQLKKVLREIAAWVENAPARDPGASAEEIARPESTEPVQQEPPAPDPSFTNVPFSSTLPPPLEVKDMLPFRKKKKPELSELPEPPKSIAVQIDELLQTLLPDSPLRGQDIRLSEDITGGLMIVHGIKQYQGIDDVEDVEVRDFIKNAVRLWNEQNRLAH